MTIFWKRLIFFLFKLFVKGMRDELSKKNEPPEGSEGFPKDRYGDTKG